MNEYKNITYREKQRPESRVYEVLSKRGAMTPTQIHKRLGMEYSSVLSILGSLTSMGVVELLDLGYVKAYRIRGEGK